MTSFRFLPECSVGGRGAIDSDPREAPGSKLAWCQFQRVSLPWMMVSGLILCVIVVRLLKINSSLKDVWNLSLPSLPLHLICSCRHLSMLKLRRVLPVSQSLGETKSPSNTQRRNGELFHASFRKDETVRVPLHPKADLVVKEEGVISQECWEHGSGKCLPKAQMGCYSSS